MNYSDLTRQFWEYNEKEPIGAVAASIYLFLLEVWTKNKEKDFTLSDTEMCTRLKITRPTIITLRQKLSCLGMIEYQPRNGLPGSYKIISHYFTESHFFENLKKTIPEKKKTTAKPKKKKETSLDQNLTSNNVSENSTSTILPLPVNIPSEDEFSQYPKTLKSYRPELDKLIKEKYVSWIENGWKNGYNKPITNWKSSIKNTIPFLLNDLLSNNSISSEIILQTIKPPKSTEEKNVKLDDRESSIVSPKDL